MSAYTDWRNEMLEALHEHSEFAWKAALWVSAGISLYAVVTDAPLALLASAGFAIMAAWTYIVARWLT